jgi:protein phosphatase
MPDDRRNASLATTPVPPEPAAVSSQGVVVSVDASGLSDRGLKRANNEDHFLISRIDRTWYTLQTNVPAGAFPSSVTDTVTAQIVADGMGGKAGGEVASRTAIAAFVEIVQRTPNLILRLDTQVTQDVLQRMAKRFERVKEALEEVVRHDPTLSGMGTTMTLACNFGADLLVAHVGDSRAYLFRQGRLERLTRDQTLVQFLCEDGMLTEAEVATHPMRHVLTGVLGTQGTPIDVELRFVRLEHGDQILLCSDGLTEMVADDAIGEALAAAPTPADACRRLVDIAIENGGADNVTVVVSRYEIPASVA